MSEGRQIECAPESDVRAFGVLVRDGRVVLEVYDHSGGTLVVARLTPDQAVGLADILARAGYMGGRERRREASRGR